MRKSRPIISILTSLVITLLLMAALPVTAQKNKSVEPELSAIVAGKGWKVHNRVVSAVNDPGWKGVRFDEKSGDGMAWLEGFNFSDGVIEFDVRGKNVFQRSFVGVAFHGVDEKTYEAVYLRPFNFRSADPAKRSHGVQYIAHPDWTWSRLRREQSGKYEQPVNPVPDPDSWVHVRVIVAGPRVSVFISNSREPSLSVQQLSNRREGLLGLWVGEGSGGDFANLKITPAK